MRHRSSPIIVAVLSAALVLGVSACGGSSSSPSSASTPAAGGSSSGTTGSGGGGGKTVNVSLKDFSIELAGGTHLTPGQYTFHATNDGATAHNLTIDGPGVKDAATPTFASGSKDLSVTLKSGTYDFYCSVPGHKAAGMTVNVTVGM